MTDQPSDLTQVEPEAAFADLEVDAPRVGIIMGSKSDMEVMEKAGAVLQEAGVSFEIAKIVERKMVKAIDSGMAQADWSAIAAITRSESGLG